jgi:Translation elongation factors (GTPases)
MHPVDSLDSPPPTAPLYALIDAPQSAHPWLLEPTTHLGVKAPEEHMGDIISDISRQSSNIHGMESDGRLHLNKAHFPPRALYNYATTLSSLTGGRGLPSEEFSPYEKMPPDAEQKGVASKQKDEDE